MNAAELLSTLVARGIEFQVHGDKIRFRPAERLSAEEIKALRENKPELLKMLQAFSMVDASGPHVDQGRDQKSEPAEIPLNRLCSPPKRPSGDDRRPRLLTVCDRCGSVNYTDVIIHDGRSLRRDCARCNRFMGWPRWYDELFNSRN